MFLTSNFKPAKDEATNRQQAEHWLNKAVNYEIEGKGEGIIRLSFNKALDYETAAVNGITA